jgi:hypothetical protein
MSQFPQSLLEDPNIAEIAASMNMTPEQYLQSILDKQQSPILNTLEAGPRMDTGPTVATQPAPVLTPRVPGEGVIAAPVANPADAPTSYADMSPQDFQRMAQNPADVPAGAEFPGLGADFSGIERFDSAMEQRTQAAREGIDQGVLQQQAASGDARALAELERRKNTVQNAGVLPTAANEPIPMEQAAAERANAALAATEGNRPVLINTTTPAPTTANTAAQTPALSTTSSTTATRTPALSRGAGNMTANARGSALGMIPRGEGLIRIGGAMYSGALKGDGIGAATREYGSIQDANRKAEVDAYNKAETTRIAELRAKRTGSKADSKAAAKNAASLQAVNDAMYGMQRGLDAIAESRASGGNLTGIGGIFKGIFDNFTGDPDANRRMILSRLRVDDALLRVAETKGAISNAEMKLFLSPAPTNLQDEQVWEDWINERMAALQRVQNRLSGGEELPAGQRSNEFNTSSGTYTPSADVQAVLDKYN